jgi:tetratricopeptide (TPR) repeat protein
MSRKKKRNKKEPQRIHTGNLSQSRDVRGWHESGATAPSPGLPGGYSSLQPSSPETGESMGASRRLPSEGDGRRGPELSNSYFAPAPALRRSRAGILLLASLLICSAIGFLLFRAFPRVPSGFPDLPDITQQNSALRELIEQVNANARNNPNSAESIGRLAMAYHANLFFESAQSAYRLTARLAPNDYRWWYYQALLQENTAQQEALIGSLEKTVQLQPNYLPANQKLADLFFKQDQLQKASTLYTRIHEVDRLFLPAILGLARVAASLENWTQVVQYLEPIVNENPRLRQAHQMLADAYQALGHTDRATAQRKILNQSNLITLPPGDDRLRDELDALCYLATPLLKLAYTAESTGNFEKMLQLCRRAVEVEPTDADAQHYLARSLILARGDDPMAVSEAMSHRDEALRLRPDYLDPLMLLSQALLDRGNSAAAVDQLKILLVRKPDHEGAHNTLGIALTGQGRIEEATSHFLEALRLKPDYAEAHNNLGNLLFRRGNWQEARTHYLRSLQLKPDYAEAHYNLGSGLAGQGKSKEAISHFSAALQLKPDHVQAHNDLGVALLNQREFEAAIGHFSEALRIQPDFAPAEYNWGLTLARGGNLEEAAAHFTSALRIKPDYVQAQESLQMVRNQQAKLVAAGGNRRP